MTAPKILVLEGLSGSSSLVRAAGGDPVSAYPSSENKILSLLDDKKSPIHGVLLTGGGDVDPRLYGQKPHQKVYGVSESRDLVERVVLEIAASRGLPVFGICRGLQITNVHHGGTLNQHIPGHSGVEHPVVVTGPLMKSVVGESIQYVVSLHHQCVAVPANGMSVAAVAHDGTPEAIESDDGRVLVVQFHPEMDGGSQYSRDLFRWLVTASADRAGEGVEARAVNYTSAAKPADSHTKLSKSQKRKNRKNSAKNRTTGTKHYTGGSSKLNGPVHVYYYCGQCGGITFEDKGDYVDHMAVLHDIEVDSPVVHMGSAHAGTGTITR